MVLKYMIPLTVALQVAVPIPKEPGKQCPSGYASGSNYCTPMSGSGPAIIKKGPCPSGWMSSGGACLMMEPRR